MDIFALQHIFSFFPRNNQILSVKRLSKGLRAWCKEQESARGGKLNPLNDIPSWAIPALPSPSSLTSIQQRKLTYKAALNGNVELLCWLRDHGCSLNRELISVAAMAGHVPVLQWLKEEGVDVDIYFLVEVCRAAAIHSQAAVLQWVWDNYPRERATCMNRAHVVHAGSKEVLTWAKQQGRIELDAAFCSSAAERGDLKALEWAQENGCPWDKESCKNAADRGHLQVLQWLRAQGCPWDQSICDVAFRQGHYHVLEWARENGCPWKALDTSMCCMAAREGDLRGLQWLRAQGCPWDESTCDVAFHKGHYHVLEWARGNGCPWKALDASMRSMAAREGDLTGLQWLRAQGCPWDARTCEVAARWGQLRVLKWARAHGCPWDSLTYVAALAGSRAGRRRSEKTVEALRQIGITLSGFHGAADPGACRELSRSDRKLLQWVRDNGCPEHD